jgi:hypothetical protein
MEHLYNSRKQELETMGYNDPTQVHQGILNEEAAIVSQSLMNRASPAERLYSLAKMRGYQPQGEASTAGAMHPPRLPKSLAGIPGSSPTATESFDAKAARLAGMDMHEDIMGLDPKELEKLLKRYVVR